MAVGKLRTLQEWSEIQNPRLKKLYEPIRLTREQEEAVDRLYLENYGKKIPYIWHRLYTGFTGQFDPAYFPELLFIPKFERYENLCGNYVRVLNDKNLLPLLFARADVRLPKTVLSCARGLYSDGDFNPISAAAALSLLQNAGEVFVKPTVETNSGLGCFVARFENGVDVLSGRSAEATLSRLGNNFAVQERLVCHESIRKLYPGSVNTFRVLTYRWKDDILFAPSVMRLGRGESVVDNAGAGGIFLAIEEDGRLHRQAFSESGEVFERHPDTGIVFDGYAFPAFPKVMAAAKRLQGMIPQLGTISWDFTLDESGMPTLIEMNTLSAGIFMQQMSHGKGLFGENTAEVLRWIRLMDHTRPADREKYAFGKGV